MQITLFNSSLENTPFMISDCYLWYSGRQSQFIDTTGTTLTTNGSTIGYTPDASKNSHPGIQTSGSNQPKYDGINRQIVFENYYPQNLNPQSITLNRQNFSLFTIGDLTTTRSSYRLGLAYQFLALLGGGGFSWYLDAAGGGRLSVYDGTLRPQNIYPYSSRCLLGCVGTATSITLYVNNTSISTTNFSSGTFTLDNVFSNNGLFSTAYNTKDFIAYNRALNVTEVNQLVNYGVSEGVVVNKQVHLCTDGDSITVTYGSTLNNGWQKQAGFVTNYLYTNAAQESLQMQNALTQRATRVDVLKRTGKTNILFVFLGTNDYSLGGRSATQLYNDTVSYGTGATTVWDKVIFMGMLPRTGTETNRQTLRTNMLNDFNVSTGVTNIYAAGGVGSTYGHYYIDLGGDTGIGQSGQQLGSNYADTIHPNNTGYEIIAGYALNMLNILKI